MRRTAHGILVGQVAAPQFDGIDSKFVRQFVHGALDRHGAAVQLGEELHHGQAQSRPLELARQAAVDLTERPEELLEPLR